jgi:invasion protein IalB
MRMCIRSFPLFAFLFLVFTLSSFSAAQAQTSAQWTTHTDPSGFSVSTPAGWSVSKDSKQGRIALRGARGEQIVVWPIFIEQKQLNSAGAAQLVMQLARKLDGNLPWTPASAQANAARVVARGSQRSGTTLMTWSDGPTGATVTLYALEAPADVYRSSTNTFAKILQSFHEVPDAAAQQPGARAGSGPLTYVNWKDPQEGAFTIQVPNGWHVVGGAYRLTATDIRENVTMVSSDGQIRVFIGDTNLGAFTEPNQMLAMGGLREGSFQTLGDGSRLEIRRFMPGQQLARWFAQSRLSSQCSGFQVESNNDRQDLAGAFMQSVREEGMNSARLTAGDAAFSCTGQHGPVHGHIFAATVYPFPGRSGIWYIYRLYGYFAAPERQQDAEKVAQQTMQSWSINPQWQAQEKQIANQAVQQDNARSQQIRARAMQAIQENERQTSQMIVDGYNQRSQVYTEISRRRENSILGTSDVIDPATGTQYKVDSLSDYHWMSNQGVIAGTKTDTSPGYGWNEMVTLP